MMFSKCSKSFSGPSNLRAPSRSTPSFPSVYNPSKFRNNTHRFYSSDHKHSEELDKFGVEEEKKLQDTPQPTVLEHKEEVRRYKTVLSDSYKDYYGSVAGPGVNWREEYTRDILKLSPQKQAAVKELGKLRDDAINYILEKYGPAFGAGLGRLDAYAELLKQEQKPAVRVAITGAAGAIGYAITFRIASGGVFGPRTPVILQLLELPNAINALKGVQMELLDCAFPTLQKIVITDKPEQAFEEVDYALLIGAQPRTKGMERGDLLLKNAEIFATQGKALNKVGKKDGTRVYVVGNPANTNALIASHNAPLIPPKNFIAMTRLDHNRGVAKLAEKTGSPITDISRFIIWGNHSATQFPDISHTLIKDRLASDLVEQKWYESEFIPGVQQRGAEIIKAMGSSSAASAASAAIEGIHDWHFGTAASWTSAGVHSSGEYGITPGLFYSYPTVFNDERNWDIVKNLPITPFSAEKMELTHKELLQERDGVTKYLK